MGLARPLGCVDCHSSCSLSLSLSLSLYTVTHPAPNKPLSTLPLIPQYFHTKALSSLPCHPPTVLSYRNWFAGIDGLTPQAAFNAWYKAGGVPTPLHFAHGFCACILHIHIDHTFCAYISHTYKAYAHCTRMAHGAGRWQRHKARAGMRLEPPDVQQALPNVDLTRYQAVCRGGDETS